MVNDSRQRLPELPAGLPKDDQHETANQLHSAAVRLLRTARAADTDLDLDGPRASLLSVLVFAGPQPVTKLAELEQVSRTGDHQDGQHPGVRRIGAAGALRN